MYRAVIVAVMLVTFTAAVSADSVRWELDAAHSTVGFSVRHLGISKVRGKFTDVKAHIKADSQSGKIHWVKATVGVASIDTGIEKRDNHLRSPEFFDVKKFPKMELVTKSIKWSGNDISGVAKLTIKGTTMNVKYKGEYHGAKKVNLGGGDQMRAGYSVSAKIDRRDYGLDFNSFAEGVAVVGDTVTIELEIEIVRAI